MNRGTARLVLAATAVMVTATACAVGTGDLDSPGSPVARYDWDPSSGGDQALLEGELVLVDGCLVVQPTWEGVDDVQPQILVVSRKLASWDAEREVLTYAGHDVSIGDEIWAGGGYTSTVDGGVSLPDACETLREDDNVFLVQSSDLTR